MASILSGPQCALMRNDTIKPTSQIGRLPFWSEDSMAVTFQTTISNALFRPDVWYFMQIFLKCILWDPIDNESVFVPATTGCRTGDKRIPEPMYLRVDETRLGYVWIRICICDHFWVNLLMLHPYVWSTAFAYIKQIIQIPIMPMMTLFYAIPWDTLNVLHYIERDNETKWPGVGALNYALTKTSNSSYKYSRLMCSS